MKTMRLVAIAFMLASGTVLAQTATSFGQADCGQWLSQKTELRKGWILGYLSGMNIAHMARGSPDTLLTSR